MTKTAKHLILGHRGMVGAALRREMPNAAVLPDGKDGARMPLERPSAALSRAIAKADTVWLCAARVGGIMRNIEQPWRMLSENIAIQQTVFSQLESGQRIVFLGSSCIYPVSDEALRESRIMTGALEETNKPYAVAKLAGLAAVQALSIERRVKYTAFMPPNLYGPGDNYHPTEGHFIAGMIRRIHEAKTQGRSSVTLWGTGRARRELLHCDDTARIMVALVTRGVNGVVNIGPGEDDTIWRWAEAVRGAVGFRGTIKWDASHPDGVKRKLMDVSIMRGLGEEPRSPYETGLRGAYEDFLEREAGK